MNICAQDVSEEVLWSLVFVKWQPSVEESHLSLNSENRISLLGVKVFYQETFEVIFYSLLDLSRLYTCSQNKEIIDEWTTTNGMR